MSDIKNTIYVQVEWFDGQEEDDTGYPYYVAHNDDLHFTTDGETFEELLKNIGEVIALCLEDTNSIAEYSVAPNAKVIIVMELPENYAQTA